MGRRYNIDEKYFQKIDTANKAYFFGWILSDGCVSKNEKQIRLKIADIEILELFKQDIGYTGPLISNKKKKEIHKEVKSLILCNLQLTKDIINLGCPHQKSYNLQFPTSIPKEFLPDFIRGFFDGDGCAHILAPYKDKNICYLQASFISTKEFCEGLKYFLEENNIHSGFKIDKRHSKEVITLSIKDYSSIKNLYNLMYNGNITLKRKEDKFKEYFNRRKEYEDIAYTSIKGKRTRVVSIETREKIRKTLTGVKRGKYVRK